MLIKQHDPGVKGRLFMVIGVIFGVIGIVIWAAAGNTGSGTAFGWLFIILGAIIYFVSRLIVWIKTGKVQDVHLIGRPGDKNN